MIGFLINNLNSSSLASNANHGLDMQQLKVESNNQNGVKEKNLLRPRKIFMRDPGGN